MTREYGEKSVPSVRATNSRQEDRSIIRYGTMMLFYCTYLLLGGFSDTNGVLHLYLAVYVEHSPLRTWVNKGRINPTACFARCDVQYTVLLNDNGCQGDTGAPADPKVIPNTALNDTSIILSTKKSQYHQMS